MSTRPPPAVSGGWPGVCDYYSKYEYGWHIAPTCTGTDAIAAVQLAISEAERLAGGVALAEQLRDPATGAVRRIKLVTDNGGAGVRLAEIRAPLPHGDPDAARPGP